MDDGVAYPLTEFVSYVFRFGLHVVRLDDLLSFAGCSNSLLHEFGTEQVQV